MTELIRQETDVQHHVLLSKAILVQEPIIRLASPIAQMA